MGSALMLSIGDFWQWLEDEVSRQALTSHLRDLLLSSARPQGLKLIFPRMILFLGVKLLRTIQNHFQRDLTSFLMT